MPNIIGFLIIFIYWTSGGKSYRLNFTRIQRDDVCQTKGCLRAAEIIKQSLNSRMDPCNDFYEFACGGFISRVEIPKNSLGVNSFSTIREITFHQVREILTKNVEESDIEPFRIAKQFFRDCMDEDTILNNGLAPIVQKIRQLGGWPVADGWWDENAFSWIDVVEKSRRMGFTSNYILSFDIETNLLNSSSRVIYVSPPDLGIPAFNLKSGIADSKVQFYYKLMVSLAVKLKVPVQEALIQLASSLLFEIQLAQNFPTTYDKKDDINKTYVSMSIREAQERFPSLQWMKFLTSMLNPSVTLSESEVIVVAFPDFMENLQTILATTSKRILANYIVWRTIFFSLNSYLVLPDIPRWKSCVAVTADKLDLAVGAMYVRRFFQNDTKQRIIEMSANIRDGMYETLSKSQWIDETTRKNALDKIKGMTENIAYPEILLDDNKLVEIYQGLRLRPGHYYESLLIIKKFLIDFTISTLRQPVQKNDWKAYENPLIVNAFYALPENSIKIPVAVLQSNVFQLDRPNYLNYGAIGVILGHELSHAFDDQGSSFDKDGNYKDWWPYETKMKYLEKVQCYVDQYSNYAVDGIAKKVNGLITQGENIADNEGVREAYYAYKKWVVKNGREPKLAGLDYTPEQLFWIGAANVWCSKYQPIYLEFTLAEDLHAPDKIRIIGAFSNQPEFAKDFGCAAGSPMNPKKKCSLWT